MLTSMAVHGGFFALLILAVAVGPAQVLQRLEPLDYKVIFLPEPGRGGGGGGSPAPAPKKQLEIPKHTAPASCRFRRRARRSAAVAGGTDPDEYVIARAVVGNSSISMAAWGGGGSGGGIGSGPATAWDRALAGVSAAAPTRRATA